MSEANPIICVNGPVLVFGGCYSNLEATTGLLEQADKLDIPAARRICTGDVVAYGADAEACVTLIRNAVDHVVMGNCEESLAAGAIDCGCGFPKGSACDRLSSAWFAHADRQISPDSRNWMASLPRRIDLEIGGKRLAVVHGGVDTINRFIFASTSARTKQLELHRASVDGVISGHCGLPFSQLIANRLWHNSGAIGMPANDGTSRGWFSVLSSIDGVFQIEHRALDYDDATAAAKMRAAGLPNEYAQALETGLWANCEVLPATEIKERGMPIHEGRILWSPGQPAKRRGKVECLKLWPDLNRNATPRLSQAKFRDPLVTADGQARAAVELNQLKTLWFNTGTLCNIECRNCYIKSSPKNNSLAYLTRGEVATYLDEIVRDRHATREIGFTGGEPFLNPDILAMIDDCLDRDFEVLILTNAMRPMQRHKNSLLELRSKGAEKLKIRVSLDHYAPERHEDERGPGSYWPTLDGLIWLAHNGFNVSVAGRTMWRKNLIVEREGYAALFRKHAVNIDSSDPAQLILFPEMDAQAEIPEITAKCWDILGKSPSDVMCSHSRMVVKRKGSDRPMVVACTLLPYEDGFELGATLRDAAQQVHLNHPHCAQFCVLGGASCSVAADAALSHQTASE